MNPESAPVPYVPVVELQSAFEIKSTLSSCRISVPCRARNEPQKILKMLFPTLNNDFINLMNMKAHVNICGGDDPVVRLNQCQSFYGTAVKQLRVMDSPLGAAYMFYVVCICS